MEKSVTKPRVLIAPLDWGLGHATRCIPVIRTLLEYNAIPIIAAYGSGYNILKKEFPDLTFIKFPGLEIKYPKKINLVWKMIASIPRMLRVIYKENRMLKRLVEEYNIDIVISDSRFGLYNKKVTTVFISHQLRIKLPHLIRLLEFPFYVITLYILKKYDYCWMPDMPGENNLAGDLCHVNIPSHSKFIGPLSRFKKFANIIENQGDYILILISGLEKQRSVFEKIMITQAKKLINRRFIIVRGKIEDTDEYEIGENIIVYSHIDAASLYDLMLNSKMVVCRAGYSSLMELASIGKKVILIPTPGQTEQEYLAEYFQEKGYAPSFAQHVINLDEAINLVEGYKGLPKLENRDLLKNAIKELLENVAKQ